MTDALPGPLTGLRGIVLTQAWAGTFATELLGLLGMEIVQIEARQRLDSWRGGYGGAVPKAIRDNGTAVHPWNCNPLYNSVNLNKRAITLNLSHPEGVAIFKRLVPFADVVAENFSPRVMGNLGLDYAALTRIRPDVILLSMSAYGATGPYANVPGIGGTIEPMAGMSALLGYEDGPPLNSGQMYPDPVAGYYGAAAGLIALHHRERTGEGQQIDLSMQEANMTFIADALMEYSAGGRVRGRIGNHHS
ncbi:MAG: CoA transferase, partial [Dehalococcoidia bacterium]